MGLGARAASLYIGAMPLLLRTTWAVFGLSLAIAGCAESAVPPRSPAQLESMRAELMQADRDFAKATAERGVEGWVSFFAEDGAQVPKDHDLVVGHEAIRAFMAPTFSKPEIKLVWEPVRADVGQSGDLGYTFGRAKIMHTEPGAEPKVVARMKYVTVWKRQPDRSWKVVIDVGNEDP